MQRDLIAKEVEQFIKVNYLFDEKAAIDPEQSLITSGIVDSTGILELITFLEKKYQLVFEDQDLVADNFGTIARIASFVERKTAA